MPELTFFDACNDAATSISDRGTRALHLAKEGTGANNVPTPDTEETKLEGMEIDNEFSDLSMDDSTQKFNYPTEI